MHIHARRDRHPALGISVCVRCRLLLWTLLLVLGLALGACTSGSALVAPIRPTRISQNVLLPIIEVTPNSGYAGVYIEVTGSNWPSNSLVLLALEDSQGRGGILAATNANGDGDFETGFLYPTSQRWLSPGEYAILAYSGDGNNQTIASFTVTGTSAATPTLTPTAAPVAEATSTAAIPAPEEPITTTVETPTPTPSAGVAFQDWRGEYWDNPNFQGSPVLVRAEPAVVFDWGGNSPADSIPADYFSARWSRPLYFAEGVYRFFLEVDDGARLYIDDVPILDDWREGSPRSLFVDYALSEGIHQFQVDYYEATERAVLRFWWERR